ncbi:hypothetical protein LINGRAHAP2_LOCUS15430 [Linum grandiflorum]
MAGGLPMPIINIGEAMPQVNVNSSQRSPVISKINPADEEQNKFINRVRAIAEANLIRKFDTLDPIRWIGKIVTKVEFFNPDPADTGCVVNYFPDRKLYEVLYRSGKTEFVHFDQVQFLRHVATLMADDRDDIKFDSRLARWSQGVIEEEEREDAEEEEEGKGAMGPPESTIASSSSSRPVDNKGKGVAETDDDDAAPKRRKTRKARTKQEHPSTYVALAFREKKADDYYWYDD